MTEAGAFDNVKAMPGNMLVGEFTHADGGRYIMVVNNNFGGSIPGKPGRACC
jgi:hypothetical protein